MAYLVHYGIQGQKWGIRRYENPDGTLTEAGKRRYYTSGYTSGKLYSKKAMNASARRYADTYRFVSKTAKANKETLSEEELKQRIAKEYHKGTGKTNIGGLDAGRDYAAYLRKRAIGKQVATNAVGYAFATAGLGWFQFGNPRAKKMKMAYDVFTAAALNKIKDEPALIEKIK